MHSASSPPVVLLYDERHRQQSKQIAESIGLLPVALSEVATAPGMALGDIVINVDLSDLSNVVGLRSAMSRFPAKRSMIFAIDAHRHASRTQANALGATALINAPLDSSSVKAALEKLGRTVTPPARYADDGRPGTASVRAGAMALDTAFKSLSAGKELDVREAIDASRQLLEGIGQAGVTSWLDTVRHYHQGTFQHCLLVTGAAVAFAKQSDMDDKRRMTLAVAALLHDIGKAAIPLEILDKPGALTDAELAVIKQHPLIGRDYLLGQKLLPPEVISAVTHHHELLDGSGYPFQLQGAEIDPLTRILTVCDVYGALSEQRAYKKPKSPFEAIMVLVDMAESGKVEYEIVRTLGAAVGVKLPRGKFRLG